MNTGNRPPYFTHILPGFVEQQAHLGLCVLKLDERRRQRAIGQRTRHAHDTPLSFHKTNTDEEWQGQPAHLSLRVLELDERRRQ